MDPFSPGLFYFIPIFMIVIFVIVIGVFIFSIVKGIKTSSYNNAQPVLAVWAKVVSKRTDVTHYSNNNNNMSNYSSSTRYYVTFEVESKDRMELNVNGEEFGMLSEGDTGKLTFQGTRYKGFEREL
ncbi:MAG: DUF2500 domain-containing protein [Bacillota bacterium]|nr:DUF2500 domain-containing protein [Bacillota bacterium]